MKLSTFILDNIESILQEWENFARTIFPSSQQTSTEELRDHAKEMLLVIVSELEHKQLNLMETPAEVHGASRLEQGFTVCELALEYQALRKSVMKLFGDKNAQIHPAILNDLVQFNESLDRALNEAIITYTQIKEQQTHLFDTMLSVSPNLSYILDLNGNFLYVNKAMASLSKQPAHALLGKANYNFAMPTAADVREHIHYILETKKECHGEIHVKESLNQISRFFEYVYAPVFDKHQRIVAIAGTSREITQQKQAEDKLWHHANYDYLTNLANRRRFRDKLEDAVKQTKRSEEQFALFFIDLDKFKEVNDTLGHDSGDLLLKDIAGRIRTCVRDTDVVSRIGGDEFAIILLSYRDAKQAKVIAEKLLSEIRKPVQLKQTMVSLTASIGVTFSSIDADEPEGLLGKADRAMYAAKKLGGNKYVFYKNDQS